MIEGTLLNDLIKTVSDITLYGLIAFIFVYTLKRGMQIFERVTERFDSVMDFFDKRETTKLVHDFDHIHAIMTFHMEAAYETIHKDNILVYSLDGTKPDEEDINKLGHEYVKLFMRLTGPVMFETFVNLYGDEETVFFVALDYFNRKFDDDEIRKSALENIQEGEDY